MDVGETNFGGRPVFLNFSPQLVGQTLGVAIVDHDTLTSCHGTGDFAPDSRDHAWAGELAVPPGEMKVRHVLYLPASSRASAQGE